MVHKWWVSSISILVAAVASGLSADASDIADFYRGKTVTMIVGYAPGGNYDITSRLISRHLAKFIPGTPTVVVKNMPGAGSIPAINHMYNIAPKDGTTIATIGRALPQLALLGDPNIKFQPERFTWLGSVSSYADDAFVLFYMRDRPVQSWADLRKGDKKLILGAVSSGSTNLTFALIAKDVLKLNIDIIRGYSGAAPIYLAMQRGEVDGQGAGLASIKTSQKDLWEGKKLRVLLQFGRTTRLSELADVPTGRELTNDPDALALIAFAEAPFYMALPFIAPPDLPKDRADALQDAFRTLFKDADFVSDGKKIGIDMSPIDGAAVGKLVQDLAKTPPDVIKRYKAIQEAK